MRDHNIQSFNVHPLVVFLAPFLLSPSGSGPNYKQHEYPPARVHPPALCSWPVWSPALELSIPLPPQLWESGVAEKVRRAEALRHDPDHVRPCAPGAQNRTPPAASSAELTNRDLVASGKLSTFIHVQPWEICSFLTQLCIRSLRDGNSCAVSV